MSPFKVAIASGKGGTGKTTVSIGLYEALKRKKDLRTTLFDCDVEEPNDHLFFQGLTIDERIPKEKSVAQIDTRRCSFCRKCVEYCEFNAIVVLPGIGFAEVNKDLCHSCGACIYACPEDAINEEDESIGIVSRYQGNRSEELVEGRLKIGSTMQTMLIRETKKHATEKAGILLYDAPPGTSCPVVETISDCDYVILVAEPTPFGLNDLGLMLELLNEIEIPHGIVINKAGIGNDDMLNAIADNGQDIIASLPFSRDFASNIAGGNISGVSDPAIHEVFEELSSLIIEKARK